MRPINERTRIRSYLYICIRCKVDCHMSPQCGAMALIWPFITILQPDIFALAILYSLYININVTLQPVKRPRI